jgi:16S rRNA processing protein RimM
LLTDFPERFESRKQVFLAPPEFIGAQDDARASEVSSFWLPVGRNEGRIVLHLKGIESIDDAESLAGLDVLVPATERAPLEDDANYISDLVGCTLYDLAVAGSPLEVGIVTDVQFAMTPDGTRRLEDAAPLLSVEAPDGSEILIPFVKAFLVSLDPAARRIEMSLPPGLIDVNRS